jgi:putative DNA primase/helicase
MESEPIINPYTDIANAKIFYDLFKDNVRWCKDYGGWFIYNGKYWKKDCNDNIKSYAIKTYPEICKRMKDLGGKGRTHARTSGSNSRLNAMIDCAKAFLGCNSHDFDSNEFLFNCENGTFNLETGKIQEFNPNDMLTKTAYVLHHSTEKAPIWEKFINDIFLGDKETIGFFQRAAGYSMTASNKEQAMFILYGRGRNGKGSLIQTLGNVFGDYAMNCPSQTLLVKNGNTIPNDVARLKGARFVMASETNQNVTLDEALIKQITGGDKITARFLNKEFFEFLPTFKIFFATNHKPNIRGTDTGIWRRIKMIPFNLNISEQEEDRNLGDKLAKESTGILNWMIEGYNQWKIQGLNTPEHIKQTTQIYREEEDDLGQFIKDECVVELGATIVCHEFRERFKEVMGYYKGNKTISEYMMRNGHKPTDDNRFLINGKQQRGYVNIRWRSDMDNRKQEKIIQWTE